MTRFRECWRCWLLELKHRVWCDADFLYVTTSTHCEAHKPPGEPENDLAAEYQNYADTAAKFEAVASSDGEQLLVDAALRWQDDVDAIAATTRDKAKTLFGAGSLAFTLLFAGIGFVSGGIGRLPRWSLGAELALLALVASHLIRALVTSIDVMTREEIIRPSLQEYVKAAESKRPRPHVAAVVVSSANAYHEKMLPRIGRIIIAKTAFKWALMWMVPLMTLQLLVAFLYLEPPKTAAAVNSIREPAAAPRSETASGEVRARAPGQAPAGTSTAAPSIASASDSAGASLGTERGAVQGAGAIKPAKIPGGGKTKHAPVQRRIKASCDDTRVETIAKNCASCCCIQCTTVPEKPPKAPNAEHPSE